MTNIFVHLLRKRLIFPTGYRKKTKKVNMKVTY